MCNGDIILTAHDVGGEQAAAAAAEILHRDKRLFGSTAVPIVGIINCYLRAKLLSHRLI